MEFVGIAVWNSLISLGECGVKWSGVYLFLEVVKIGVCSSLFSGSRIFF